MTAQIVSNKCTTCGIMKPLEIVNDINSIKHCEREDCPNNYLPEDEKDIKRGYDKIKLELR